MNESLQNSAYSTSPPAQSGLAAAAIWPALAGTRGKHKLVEGVLKAHKDLPLFCNPVALFVFNWAFMMASLSAQITYVTYPLMDIPILLCALSVGSFFFGYLVAHTTLLRGARAGESLLHTRCHHDLALQSSHGMRGPHDHFVQLGDQWASSRARRSDILFDLWSVQTSALSTSRHRNSELDARFVPMEKSSICNVRHRRHVALHYARIADGSFASNVLCLRNTDEYEQTKTLFTSIWVPGCWHPGHYHDWECAYGP